MNVLIQGLEMPQEGFVEVLIRDDGTVQRTGESYRIDGTDYYTPYVGDMPVIYKAVPVPPHGRLIDEDELIDELIEEGQHSKRYKVGEFWELNGSEIRAVIARTPTVIPAEPKEEEI